MIHYTLLPEKDIKSLKKEYRTRLSIVLFFFVSCAIFIGIISLFPSFLLSYSREKDILKNLQALQEGRRERGTDMALQQLSSAQELASKLKTHENKADFSQIISEIIARKSSQVTLTSFRLFNQDVIATSSLDIVVQGKALTRDSLISFKKSLEQNPLISKMELPVSDLAKSKDISFDLTFSIKTP